MVVGPVASDERARHVALDPSRTELAARAMEIFPADARPILVAVYICPTESYKETQHACSTYQVQTGRQHLSGTMSTRPTCIKIASAPPRESGRTHHSDLLMPCPTSKSVFCILAGTTGQLYTQIIKKTVRLYAANRYKHGSKPTTSTHTTASRKMA